MTVALVVVASILAGFAAVAVFERIAPRRIVRRWQKRVGAPAFRWAMGYLPGWVVIETTGRRTGRIHRVPVGGGLRDGAVWVVAGYRTADYVRNIEADPRVRVRVHGRWREGTAHLLTDDDTRRRALRTNIANGLFVAVASAAEEQVTIRIDLEPGGPTRGPARTP